MEALKRFIRQSYYSFMGIAGFFGFTNYLLIKILNPIFNIIFIAFVASNAYETNNISKWVLGSAFLLCTTNAFFGVGAILIYERSFGTLKLIIASPVDKFKIFTSKIVFYILDGIINISVGIIVGYTMFGLRIPVDKFPIFLLTVLVGMFSSCAMGLLIGSIGLITRDINLLLNLSSAILSIFTGANFAVDRLPSFLYNISNIVPLTRVIKASRLLLENKTVGVYSLIGQEALVGICYLIVGYFVLKFMERSAIKGAKIEIY
ncbi:ABC transporter permease [Clostridium hydrogenum]|uniref:ABC transporter permease n=1 Tax=Clostridium hydrogenum TaxID=2855764 RepID=UPI001F3C059C|nr:ABC transporter permease [Clostridium hydrogenum]